jgi:hypothetical protein
MASFEHLFDSLEVRSSSSASYNVNEFSLKGEAILRVSIRWGGTDYERRNYLCYYADFPDASDIFDIGDSLLEEAERKYGKDWFHNALMDLEYYLTHEFEVNSSNHMNTNNPNYKIQDFCEGARLCLLIAMNNPEEWKRNAVRSELLNQVADGVTGCHLDFIYDEQFEYPGLQVRILNSAKNDPVYIVRGMNEKTIIPKELLSYHQDFY